MTSCSPSSDYPIVRNELAVPANIAPGRTRPSHLFDKSILWVDGVGGYLILTNESVNLGQAVPQSHLDIPVFADIHRRHVRISRQRGEYLIEPFGKLTVNGRELRSKAALLHGDQLLLGDDLNVRFSKPHPLSATAKLEFCSRHRVLPSCDAILLMAESCVLGPGLDSHVICKDWGKDVVLYRDGSEFKCRSMQTFALDGCICDGQAKLKTNCRIEGDDFSLSLERTC